MIPQKRYCQHAGFLAFNILALGSFTFKSSKFTYKEHVKLWKPLGLFKEISTPFGVITHLASLAFVIIGWYNEHPRSIAAIKWLNVCERVEVLKRYKVGPLLSLAVLWVASVHGKNQAEKRRYSTCETTFRIRV